MDCQADVIDTQTGEVVGSMGTSASPPQRRRFPFDLFDYHPSRPTSGLVRQLEKLPIR